MTTYHCATQDIMSTKASIQRYVNGIFKTHKKCIRRVLVDSKSRYRKDGYVLQVFGKHCFMNIDIDNKFNIEETDITFRISNSKVHLTVWKDGDVTPNICVY